MKETPSVWVVSSWDDGVQCIFYYETEARAWVENLDKETWELPWEHFYIEGPFVVN